MAAMIQQPIDQRTQLEEIYKRIESLESQLDELKKRNERVDGNKMWEIGLMRKGTIVVVTYLVTLGIFTGIEYLFADEKTFSYRPFINAFVPTTGYVISTLALSCMRGCC